MLDLPHTKHRGTRLGSLCRRVVQCLIHRVPKIDPQTDEFRYEYALMHSEESAVSEANESPLEVVLRVPC